MTNDERIPKPEDRSPEEIRKPKPDMRSSRAWRYAAAIPRALIPAPFRTFEIRASDFFRNSAFGFRDFRLRHALLAVAGIDGVAR